MTFRAIWAIGLEKRLIEPGETVPAEELGSQAERLLALGAIVEEPRGKAERKRT